MFILELSGLYPLTSAIQLIILITFVLSLISCYIGFMEYCAVKIQFYFVVTCALSIIFTTLQITEYTLHTSNLSDYLTIQFFYSLTLLHFVHVQIGILLLCVVVWCNQESVRRDMEFAVINYWHLIEFIWIILLVILYS